MGWRLWLIACLLFLLAAWRQPTNRAGSLSLAVVFGIFAAAARGADRMSRASLVPTAVSQSLGLDRSDREWTPVVRQRADPLHSASVCGNTPQHTTREEQQRFPVDGPPRPVRGCSHQPQSCAIGVDDVQLAIAGRERNAISRRRPVGSPDLTGAELRRSDQRPRT